MPQPATPRDVFHRLVNGVAKLVAGDTGQVDVLARRRPGCVPTSTTPPGRSLP
jgi:hypothetical protein